MVIISFVSLDRPLAREGSISKDIVKYIKYIVEVTR